MHAWIGLGSNEGDRLSQLRCAAVTLGRIGVVRARSAIYETEAVLEAVHVLPPAASHPYLNAALCLETSLKPEQLIDELLEFESAAGRVRQAGLRDTPRPLDLDVLLLGQNGDVVMVSPSLTVPHPRLHQRAFALRPLLDVGPALIHPALSLPLRILYRLLPAVPLRPFGWL